MEKLIVSTSPHIRSDESVPRIMWTVVISLIPAAAVGCYFFGMRGDGTFSFRPVFVLLGSIAVAVATEAIILGLRGKGARNALDGSAVITGMLFAMVCSSNIPWYVVVLGSFFSIAVAKQMFGGLGYNIWNPALIGRAFALMAWGVEMGKRWPVPMHADALSGATPLDVLKTQDPLVAPYSVWNLFIGRVPGCLGETSALLLLVGGIFLIARKYVDWRIPLSYIVTAVILCLVIPFKKEMNLSWFNNLSIFEKAGYYAFSGGLFLGAFFMATDMVTSPMTKKGALIFGIGCGALTALIRKLGGYPEGVCYSILLMNTATPIIDRWTKPKKFGEVRQQPATVPAK
jgi:electron transport complex protein RnfD